MIKGLLVFAVLGFAAQAEAQVFRCVDASGKSTFSDRPCGDNAQALTIKDNRIGGSFAEESAPAENAIKDKREEIERRYDRALEQLAAGPCKRFSSTEMRTMIIRNQVVQGMTASDAVKAWGAPTRVNGTQYAYHWNKGGSSYFYIEQGCVNTIQGGYNG